MDALLGRRRRFRRATVLLCAVLLMAGIAVPDGAAGGAVPSAHDGAGAALTDGARRVDAGDWVWPVEGARRVVERFRAPAHEYGPGHRGVDIAAAVGSAVHAPAAGIVAFRGVVVDRPLITIDHGGGIVTTFEPLESSLSPGDAVAAGDVIGTVATGGHAAAGTLHIGVRVHGVYVDPMLLFGDVARAVLLPCCAPL